MNAKFATFRLFFFIVVLSFVGILITACNQAAPTASTTAKPTATSTAEPSATPTNLPEPTATPLAPSIALDEKTPADVRAAVNAWVRAQSTQIITTTTATTATVVIGPQPGANAITLTERVFVPADWFATRRNGITSNELEKLWQGQPTSDGLTTIFATVETSNALHNLWGTPSETVRVVEKDQLTDQVWKEKTAIAIVPFDELTPRLAALPLNGQNVLSRTLALDTYPLVVRTFVSGDASFSQALATAIGSTIPSTNRDTNRMTTLVMTGVTAMGRNTGVKMDAKNDPAYPARKIAAVLQQADITHISNEIPFSERCVPKSIPNLLVLCSRPSYMAAIKEVGADIIGLTGNHMLDYGRDDFLKTLDMYDKENLKYYAGGRNDGEARRPLILEDHGNKLAFLGANSFGPEINWADATSPGAQFYDADKMQTQIKEVRDKVDVVLVEYQAEETYEYTPSYNNQQQFRRTLADGADIVTGVQAHQPQAVEFGEDGKGIILYGLGNLFFDQMFDLNVRQGLIPRHTIYAGRLLQTELLTTMLEDFSQPRWATPAERAEILRSVFAASAFK